MIGNIQCAEKLRDSQFNHKTLSQMKTNESSASAEIGDWVGLQLIHMT